LIFTIQWSDVAKLVLVMEQFPNYIVVVFDGECGSRNLAMVGSGDSMVWENGGI
jgi:hypothetical protein